MATIGDYFQNVRNGEGVPPSPSIQKTMGQTLDKSAEKVIKQLIQVLRLSPEHQQRIALLNQQSRNAGPFNWSKVLFDDLSSFEQMAALSDWLAAKELRKVHTFFFSAGDDYIPVQVKPFGNIRPNLMHVRLGATSGSHKAPKYEEWAKEDPRDEERQEIFIRPLESLENLRQPLFCASTTLKANAFFTNFMTPKDRYGSTYACVEGKGQSQNGSPKITDKKVRSAGLVADHLAKKVDDLEEDDFCQPIAYEDIAPDGYADDLDLKVTAGALMGATESALLKGNRRELNPLMRNLIFANMEVPQTPILRQYMSEQLLAPNNQE